jgi:hypothetical protein
MGNPRAFRICSGLACLWISLLYGQIKVDIGSSPDRDLKRTAHQLRITVEQLKNARAALQEATGYAAHSTDASSLSQLAQSWIRVDRAKAQGAIEAMYAQLRVDAQGASDAVTYQRYMSAAEAVLVALTLLDLDRAIDLWSQWPDPPAALGASAEQMRDQMKKQFQSQVLSRMIMDDPERALALLKEQGTKSTDVSTIIRLTMHLNQIGRKDEALDLVDQTIADFGQSTLDARTIQSYLSFVRMLPNVDSGRYLQAVNVLLSQLSQQAGPNTGGTLTVDGQSIQLSTPEAVLVDLCRGLGGRPDLMTKTLSAIPGLKSKIDSLGGIDDAGRISTTMRLDYALGNTRMSVNSGGVSITSSSPVGARGAATPSVGPSATNVNPAQTASQLYPGLRGKARKNPSFVSQKLSELAGDPNQIDVLVNLANRASTDDPDLASMALEAASRAVMQVDPLQKRISTLQNLMRTYRMCEGEVSSDLVQMGFRLVQQLREEEKNAASALPPGVTSRPPGGSSADRLEASLMAEMALENFEGTMRSVRSMPEEQRLLTLVQIVQNLSQSY